MQSAKRKIETESPEQVRSEFCCVRVDDGKPILLKKYEIDYRGVLCGVEPDGAAIHIKDWDRVWCPTVDRLRHIVPHLPTRQRAMFDSQEVSNVGGPANVE